jgi:hypothetical protein
VGCRLLVKAVGSWNLVVGTCAPHPRTFIPAAISPKVLCFLRFLCSADPQKHLRLRQFLKANLASQRGRAATKTKTAPQRTQEKRKRMADLQKSSQAAKIFGKARPRPCLIKPNVIRAKQLWDPHGWPCAPGSSRQPARCLPAAETQRTRLLPPWGLLRPESRTAGAPAPETFRPQ